MKNDKDRENKWVEERLKNIRDQTCNEQLEAGLDDRREHIADRAPEKIIEFRREIEEGGMAPSDRRDYHTGPMLHNGKIYTSDEDQ